MSPLVSHALSEAGLLAVLEARSTGNSRALEALRPHVETVDWLLVGALADEVRLREIGGDVKVFANVAPDRHATCIDFSGTAADAGIAFLRRIALARIFGPPACRIRVSWDGLGIEIAQVALAFGATELAGAIRFKDGELVAAESLLGHGRRSRLEPAHEVKRREIARFVTRAGRRALFALVDGTFESYAGTALAAPLPESTIEPHDQTRRDALSP